MCIRECICICICTDTCRCRGICTCMCVYTYTYTHTYMYRYMDRYMYRYMHRYMYICACMCIWMCICIYERICTCTCTCMFMCICMYICKRKCIWLLHVYTYMYVIRGNMQVSRWRPFATIIASPSIPNPAKSMTLRWTLKALLHHDFGANASVHCSGDWTLRDCAKMFHNTALVRFVKAGILLHSILYPKGA